MFRNLAIDTFGTIIGHSTISLSYQPPWKSEVGLGWGGRILEGNGGTSIPALGTLVVGGIIMGRVEGWSLTDSIYFAYDVAFDFGSQFRNVVSSYQEGQFLRLSSKGIVGIGWNSSVSAK